LITNISNKNQTSATYSVILVNSSPMRLPKAL
jgi:hypothetical protein